MGKCKNSSIRSQFSDKSMGLSNTSRGRASEHIPKFSNQRQHSNFQLNPRMTIEFKNSLPFAKSGFTFIYRSSTSKGKKFLPRSYLSHYGGVEIDSMPVHVLIPSRNCCFIVRQASFHPISKDAHPQVSNFIGGLSRKLHRWFGRKLIPWRVIPSPKYSFHKLQSVSVTTHGAIPIPRYK